MWRNRKGTQTFQFFDGAAAARVVSIFTLKREKRHTRHVYATCTVSSTPYFSFSRSFIYHIISRSLPFFLFFFLSVSLSLSTHTAPNKTHHQLRSAPSMAKKRKSVATRLDEVDRTMYSTFCSTANSLSHLYTHAMNQQKLSFQAGERHGLVRTLLSYSDVSCP